MSRNERGLLVFSLILLGCVAVLLFKLATSNENINKFATEIDVNKNVEQRADEIIKKMTLEEKVGQMLFVGIEGKEVDEMVLRRLHAYHVGGVVLFDRNMQNPVQVAELVDSLQREELSERSKLPLFIAIDQEGGKVVRMEEELLAAPAAETLAQSGDVLQVLDWAKLTAEQIRSMGINVNFAPVVDIGSTYQRSYGQDEKTVTRFAEAAVVGYQSEGVIAALKHFPGLGRVKTDTHLDSDTITTPLEVMEVSDLFPYRELIRKLDNQTFFVMVAHAKYSDLDDQYPASLSEKIMRGLLREKLGYQGVIVTDDTEMGAVSKLYTFEQIGVLSVKGGADMILVCKNFTHQAEVYNGIIAAVKNGEITVERLDESVKRIIIAKLTNIRKVIVEPENAAQTINNLKKTYNNQ